MRVPADYPTLENICDGFLPLHFTWTRVDEVASHLGSDFRAIEALIDGLLSQFSKGGIGMWPVCGLVSSPTGAVSDESDRLDHPSGCSHKVHHPKVFALVAMPRGMHLHWRRVDEIVRATMPLYLGSDFLLPIRYYYQSPDEFWVNRPII